jgi:poly-gamma-glutamate synthesis protein (capsule biosynthesis protein)
LEAADIRVVGAEGNNREAAQPAFFAGHAGGRIVLLAFAMTSAGIPLGWEASRRRGGVCLLPDCRASSVERIGATVAGHLRACDVVVSIHWGPNRGDDVEPRDFINDPVPACSW